MNKTYAVVTKRKHYQDSVEMVQGSNHEQAARNAISSDSENGDYLQVHEVENGPLTFIVERSVAIDVRPQTRQEQFDKRLAPFNTKVTRKTLSREVD